MGRVMHWTVFAGGVSIGLTFTAVFVAAREPSAWPDLPEKTR